VYCKSSKCSKVLWLPTDSLTLTLAFWLEIGYWGLSFPLGLYPPASARTCSSSFHALPISRCLRISPIFPPPPIFSTSFSWHFSSEESSSWFTGCTRHKLCKALHSLKFITWKRVCYPREELVFEGGNRNNELWSVIVDLEASWHPQTLSLVIRSLFTCPPSRLIRQSLLRSLWSAAVDH